MEDVTLRVTTYARLDQLLLDEPSLVGVESIKLDTVNLRMVARTLPGKQFEVGRVLRAMVLRSLRQAGIASPTTPTTVEAMAHSGSSQGV